MNSLDNCNIDILSKRPNFGPLNLLQVAYLTKDTTKFDVHLMLRWNADGGVDGDL